MDEGLIPDEVRSDIETGVAAALDQVNLRRALARVGVTGVPDDQDDIDLIIMLVPRTHGNQWPASWHGSDTFAPFLFGYIVATIQALDLAVGRQARPLKDHQREWLAKWEEQSGYENR